jgi:CheY-like chemotaxis protein
VDPSQISQVILNLAVNARDAMPEGGKLTIETAAVELDAGFDQEHIAVRPGPYVMLSVSDTGQGMDAVTQAHIFEPFFTTKGPGNGTGLGLSTSYGIVKQSGGYIWVSGEPGHGATFKNYFPRVSKVSRVKRAAPASNSAPRGSETILLVEDEAGVRRLARSVLEERGYTVLEAASGDDAMALVHQHAGRIGLVLTDVVMPGMSGRELVQHLVAARPDLRVLYMSGYTDDAVVHHGVLTASMAFIGKPFPPLALARRVREVLDART